MALMAMIRHQVQRHLSRETGAEEAISMGELSDLLADATGTDPDEFDRQADELEIGPPEEAEVVEATDE
jgi:hypothetical protein